MKRYLAALTALLLILLCSCTAIKEPEIEATPTPALPEGMEFSESTLVRNEEIDTLLICAVSYDKDGYSTLTSLNLLVRDADGSIALLTIPKDTRVWVEYYNASGSYEYCNYGPISDVYHAAEFAGLAESKTVEAVSTLLGGVRIDRYAMLNVVQLKDLADLTDGVYVDVEDAILDYNIPKGFQNIVPNIMEYASYSYLYRVGGVDYSGTDLYKLERHQQLICALMQTLAGQMGVTDDGGRIDLAQEIQRCTRTDLTEEEIIRWLEGDALVFSDVSIMNGQQNEHWNESYWIPDPTSLKDWVMDHFYLSNEE